MASYFTTQIIEGRLRYDAVIAKYPKYKAGIDKELAKRGYCIDENGNCIEAED